MFLIHLLIASRIEQQFFENVFIVMCVGMVRWRFSFVSIEKFIFKVNVRWMHISASAHTVRTRVKRKSSHYTHILMFSNANSGWFKLTSHLRYVDAVEKYNRHCTKSHGFNFAWSYEETIPFIQLISKKEMLIWFFFRFLTFHSHVSFYVSV